MATIPVHTDDADLDGPSAMSDVTKFEVWWTPQIPMQPFKVVVPDLDTGLLMLDMLARYDLFQYENHVKPDYANEGGVRYRLPNEDEWEEVNEADEDDVAYHRQRITAAAVHA